MFLGSAISVFGKGRIHALFLRMQGKKLGMFGLIPASLLGIASPLCMYGTIPLAASFSEKGMRDDWLAAYMMSSILLNPQLLLYSAALGTKALAVRFVSCMLCGITAGVCVHFFYREKPFFNFKGFGESSSHDTDPNILLRFLKNLGRNLRATGPVFSVGRTFVGAVPAVCSGGGFCRPVWQPALVRRFIGGYHRRALVYVRRRHDPAFTGMADGWHESGIGGCVHAHRPRHKDHESGRGQNCAGYEAVSFVPGVYHCIFAGGRAADRFDTIGGDNRYDCFLVTVTGTTLGRLHFFTRNRLYAD